MRPRLLALSLLFLCGCSSAGMNIFCGNGTANGTYYVTGSGTIYACHAGCFGFNCPKPDYTAIADLTSKYIQSAKTVTATVPITVAVTPTNK